MDVEQRARELLADEFVRMGGLSGKYVEEVRKGIAGPWDRAAIGAIIAALTPPDEPDQALLVSMAMLVYHGFGLLTPEQKQAQLREMRKLWDEVMGRGYYSPDNRERYVAMLAAHPEVK
ncbi:hypothetical protein [Stenotrophomonas maltophilia]|uniref:hypothetical protein n=1 Tax=Stenotrophomonas maltophilia TaxID=40324 RepID=UPI0039C35EF4